MIFKQYNNGSCDIEFSKEEIEILSKTGKLHLSDEALRHFGNVLIKIISEWNINFNEEIKTKFSNGTEKIEGK
jgi:hypothetical protein